MRVFVAGATGVVGMPLVSALIAAGHEVTGTTRSPGKAGGLHDLGATPSSSTAWTGRQSSTRSRPLSQR